MYPQNLYCGALETKAKTAFHLTREKWSLFQLKSLRNVLFIWEISLYPKIWVYDWKKYKEIYLLPKTKETVNEWMSE